MNNDWLPAGFSDRHGDPHVVIAMSGGVDSSVAAARVVAAGLRCSALFMKNWNEPTDDGACHWEDDVADALAVCERLGIEINTVDLSSTYWERVFADFLSEYEAGRTPNPDVLCNREIKFSAFIDAARAVGGDLIATGHYVDSGYAAGAYSLLRGVDANKDQSYFLYTLGQAQLAQCLFPVGSLQKNAVRDLARNAGFAVHDKKDSTGICFIGERRFRDFLGQFVSAEPGPIETVDGRVIGEHHGAVFYTLGQRQGLGIGGVRDAGEAAWFVAGKDLGRNAVTVVQGHDHPALMSTRLGATGVSWVTGAPPAPSFRCTAKTRYRQSDVPCAVMVLEGGRIEVAFDSPQRAVTPGQSVVLYDDRRCLGGAIIDTASHDAGARPATPRRTN